MSEFVVLLKRAHTGNQEVVGVLGGFTSAGEAKHWANGAGWGLVAREPKRGGPWVVEVETLGADELKSNRASYLAAEAERKAVAEREARERAEQNAIKLREQRLAELLDEEERKAFLAERERWRKIAEKRLEKEEAEDSIPESTRATVDTLRGSTGH